MSEDLDIEAALSSATAEQSPVRSVRSPVQSVQVRELARQPTAKPRLLRQAASVVSEAFELSPIKGKPPKLQRISSEPSASSKSLQSTDADNSSLRQQTAQELVQSFSKSKAKENDVEIEGESGTELDELGSRAENSTKKESSVAAPLASQENASLETEHLVEAPSPGTKGHSDNVQADVQASDTLTTFTQRKFIAPLEKVKNSKLKKRLMKFQQNLRKSKSEDEPTQKQSDDQNESSLKSQTTTSEPALAPIEEDASSLHDSANIDNILGIHIHNVDKKLKSNKLVFHPVVKVHVIDSATGKYLEKKHLGRKVVSYYENLERPLNYVLPLMTQPCDLVAKIRYPRFPIWEELLLYNEDYNHFLREGVLLFFEILDFISLEERPRSAKKDEQWWYRIAWAFLRPLGTGGRVHGNRKLRLQLYVPVSAKMAKEASTEQTTELFSWWTAGKKIAFPGSLFVTLRPVPLAQSQANVKPSLRSLLPFQEEQSSLLFANCLAIKGVKYADTLAASSPLSQVLKPQPWSRLPGAPCKVPKNRWQEFSAGNNRSCYSLKFSNDGRMLACGASVFAAYLSAEKRSSVFIYELPSGLFYKRVHGFHLGTIYDIDWSCDDRLIMSASNDCTAQVWPVMRDKTSSVVLPHPCFIYSCRFHPLEPSTIFTGAFDGVIRLWSVRNCFESQPGLLKDPELLREIDGHQGQVLNLAFKLDKAPSPEHLVSANSVQSPRITLFSSGSNGSLILWRPKQESLEPSLWLPVARVRISELKNIPINSVQVCPGTGTKLFLCCRDGVLRMIDYQREVVVQKYPGSFNFNHLIRGSLSPCGKFVFVGSEDGYVHVWAADTGERVHTYEGLPFKGPVTCVEYHPFDNVIAICGLGGRTVSVCLYKHNYLAGSSIATNSNGSNAAANSGLALSPPSGVAQRPKVLRRGRLQKSHTVDHGHHHQAQASTSLMSATAQQVESTSSSSRMRSAMKKLEIALKMKSLEQT